MGYHTDFSGSFQVTPTLSPAHRAYLDMFANTRRMRRNSAKTKTYPDPLREAVGLEVGAEGGFFVGADAIEEDSHADSFGHGFKGQTHSKDVTDYNRPPVGQPGLWCQWVPTEDGTEIEWDGGEKFYDYVPWLKYLLDNFLIPWGYTLNGEVNWEGEESDDLGLINVTANVVTIKRGRVVYDD